MKTFYIRTLGCKVNQCDSQELRERFFKSGWDESPRGDQADLCIVNTCCVTQHADRKSRAAIRDIVRRRASGDSRIVVTGCYARYDRPAIEGIEGVDGIFETNRKEELFKFLGDGSKGSPSENLSLPCFAGRTRAFLKIQDGCDNRCSYCVVPTVRGPSRSKELSRVMDEAYRWVRAGHREIVLTGVNLGSYGKDLSEEIDLVGVIEALEKIKDLSRIRLSSIEAADITDKLIEKMAHSEKLCPHLHIPFQSGDDHVLRGMNKRLSTKDYKVIVEKAKKNIKDLAITCDFILGYPAEEEENFQNTLKFIKFVAPLRTHIFTYSPRKGVSLEAKKTMPGENNAKKRFSQFKKVSDALSRDFKKQYIGRELEVLFEEEKGGSWLGFTKNYIKASVTSHTPLRNMMTKVKITGINSETVIAEIL